MNWGNRLLIVFIVFGLGMFYLVYRSMTTNYEVVESDYYKQELRYQQVIDAHKAANTLSAPVTATANSGAVSLRFPDEMKNKIVTGEVFFYCGGDSKKDKKLPLKTDTAAVQFFPAGTISPGGYTVKVKWAAEGKDYYAEIPLTVY